MPISQFSEGLQTVISFLPGTYATSLFRNHAMNGALDALTEKGIPVDAVDAIRDVVDCNIYFFDTKVSIGAMFGIIALTITVIMTAYVLLNKFKGGKARAK